MGAAGSWGFEGWFGVAGSRGLRAGFGQVPLGREGVCGLVSAMGSLKSTIFVVFLIPQGGECSVTGTPGVLIK